MRAASTERAVHEGSRRGGQAQKRAKINTEGVPKQGRGYRKPDPDAGGLRRFLSPK